jgi:hypothetical protein
VWGVSLLSEFLIPYVEGGAWDSAFLSFPSNKLPSLVNVAGPQGATG